MSNAKSLTNMVVAAAIFCSALTLHAQDETTIYKMTLNDSHVAKLQGGQSLDSTIPEADRGDVTAILLAMADNQDKDFAIVENQVEIVGDTASINMSNSLIRQLKAQPLRMLVDKVNFAKVVMNSDSDVSIQAPTEAASDQAPAVEPQVAGAAVKMFYMNLRNGNTMTGEIDGFDDFTIQTGFGEVTIPLEQIAGIRFHTDSKDSAVVILKNGDALTGMPKVNGVKIKTEWGHADVAPEHMNSITTSSNSTFSQGQTDFGTRWQLRTSIPLNTNPRANFNNRGRVFGSQ